MQKNKVCGIQKLKAILASIAVATIIFGVNSVNADELENIPLTENSITNDLNEERAVADDIATEPEDVGLSQSIELDIDSEIEKNKINDSVNDEPEPGSAPVSGPEPVVDYEGLELINAYTDKSTYIAGETVYLTVVANSESEVNSISASLIPTTGTQLSSLYKETQNIYINSEGYYEAVLEIPLLSNLPSSSYTMSYILLEDNMSNARQVLNHNVIVSGVSFDVINDNYNDFKGPELFNAYTDKATYIAGEIVYLTLIANYEKALSSIYAQFSDVSSHVQLPILYADTQNIYVNSEGYYEAVIEIQLPGDLTDSLYTISSMYFEDQLYNEGYVYNQNNNEILSEVSFGVIPNSYYDTNSPELINVYTDKKTYMSGETGYLTLIVNDRYPVKKISLRFYTAPTIASPLTSFHIEADSQDTYVNSEGYYESVIEFQLPEVLSSTFYVMGSVYFENTTGVRKYVDSSDKLVRGVAFDVINNTFEGLTLVDAYTDKTTYITGETVYLTVIASDENEIIRVAAEFNNISSVKQDGFYNETQDIYINSEGYYESVIEYQLPEMHPDRMYNAPWVLSYVFLEDNRFNARNIYSKYNEIVSGVSFNILNDNYLVLKETHTEKVPFVVDYIKNPSLVVGTENIVQEGVDGIRTIVEEVITLDGVETQREVISDQITTPAINQIVEYGTKVIEIEDISTIVTKETRTEQISFETEYIENSELVVGTKNIIQEGVDGVCTIVEEVTTVGGVETKRTVLSNKVTTHAVNQLIEYGIKAIETEDIATTVTKETRTEAVAFELEYVNNPELLIGTEQVSQVGLKGERTIVEEVITVGDVETSREVISNEITTAPVNGIVQVGTKAYGFEDKESVVTGESHKEENSQVAVSDSSILPNTGEKDSFALFNAGVLSILAGLGFIVVGKKKKVE